MYCQEHCAQQRQVREPAGKVAEIQQKQSEIDAVGAREEVCRHVCSEGDDTIVP